MELSHNLQTCLRFHFYLMHSHVRINYQWQCQWSQCSDMSISLFLYKTNVAKMVSYIATLLSYSTPQFKLYTNMWAHMCTHSFYTCKIWNVTCIFLFASSTPHVQTYNEQLNPQTLMVHHMNKFFTNTYIFTIKYQCTYNHYSHNHLYDRRYDYGHINHLS